MKTHNLTPQDFERASAFRPDHLSPDRPDEGPARPSLGGIDFEARRRNRSLPAAQLLEVLRASAPEFFALAQIVGQWVWIEFPDKQPREITRRLAEFGFHWNNQRQVWQNPCGGTTDDASPYDPRAKYGCHFAAVATAA